jgi:hypothetical protein
MLIGRRSWGPALIGPSRSYLPMNTRILCVSLVWLLAAPACFAQTRSPSNTFRSTTEHFQITFPTDWTVREGGDVTVTALNNRGASINVAVSPYNGPEPTRRDLNQMVQLGAAQTVREYPTATILEKGLRLFAGKRGPYQKYRVTYSAAGYTVTNVVANYTLFKNARVYTITTSAPAKEYDETAPLLLASVNSFAIPKRPR